MSSRRHCNLRIVTETEIAGRPLSREAKAALAEARKAGRAGRCADMHRGAQYARALLNLRG